MLAYLQNQTLELWNRLSSKMLKSFAPSLFVLLSLAFLNGCSSSMGETSTNSNFYDTITGGSSYDSVFDKWSETARTQSNFDLVILANVTFWSPELREAYVDEMSSTFRMSEEESKALAFEQKAEDDSYFVFILSAFTRDPNWNDFNSDKSVWRLTLENQDSSIRLRPKKMEKISYKNEVAAYFYKHMDRFSETYKVYFEKEKLQSSPTINFIISGPRGNLKFNFKRSMGSLVKAADLP